MFLSSDRETIAIMLYHSVHDNFDWMSKFGDPDFTRHRTTAAVWATAALLLTTRPLPLFDVTYYSDWAEAAAENVKKIHSVVLKEKGISLSECFLCFSMSLTLKELWGSRGCKKCD